MSETTAEPTPPQTPTTIIAGPGKGYRIKFGLFGLLMVGMGAWFGYDGFVGWPEMNQKLSRLKIEREAAVRAGDSKRSQELLAEINQLNHGEPRTASDINLQKLFCFTLPPLGIYLVFRAFRNSRGEYRLEGNLLSVPGHPPVPLENITEIDRRLWDRKGIAYLNYDLGDGKAGVIRLDDYYHDRPPTDEIFKRVEEYVSGGSTDESAPPNPDNTEAHS